MEVSKCQVPFWVVPILVKITGYFAISSSPPSTKTPYPLTLAIPNPYGRPQGENAILQG